MTLLIKSNSLQNKIAVANRDYEANSIIVRFQGLLISRKEAENYPLLQRNNLQQIGADLFLDLTNQETYFLQHHCNPNAFLKIIVNNAFLVSLREIKKNEEINYDFSLTSTDSPDDWSMPCNCHRFYCRKIISGFSSMSEKNQQEAIDKKIVPSYITKRGS